jgi:HD-like signal output (HDOD) protein
MKKILSKILNFFKQKTELEEFILSKNPQNAGDVEHWTRVFNHSQFRGL